MAERGTRLGAAILDGLVYGLPVGLAVFATITMARSNSTATTTVMLFASIAIVAVVVIINLVWLHRYGQTIAKRWLKIKIVRTDGSRCSLLRILFLRSLPLGIGANILDRVLPPLGWLVRVVDALFIFRADYRCVHDHIADTIVVKA
ncbi:MAG TPA: RDD family protein [Rudaea sp.]